MDLPRIALLVAAALVGFVGARTWEHRVSMPGSAGGALGAVVLTFGVAYTLQPPMDLPWYLWVTLALGIGALAGRLTIPDRADPTIEGEDLASIRTASDLREQARRAVVDFDAGRNGWALHRRLLDAFVVSPDETIRDGAVRRIAIADAHIARFVPAWTLARADELLAADPEGSARADAAHEAHVPHRRRIDAATRLLDLARTAATDLSQAISDLESARTMEIMDAASSNKAIAAMSHASTSTASSSVERAQESMRLLSHEAEILSQDLPRVGDTIDFVLDMALDSAFDFMSWLNVGRLGTAMDQCRQALAKVEQEGGRLEGLLARAKAEGDPTLGEWYESTWRYVDSARIELPAEVRSDAPCAMPLRPY